MALGDYILCCKCDTKLIYDGDRGQREWWKQRFGKPPEIECPNCKTQRTWGWLTDDEIMDMYNEPRSDAEMIAFGREVEAKLKAKNGY